MQTNQRLSKPILYLSIFLFIGQFINGFQTVRIGHASGVSVAYSLAFYWAMGWWFINDSREYGIKWSDQYLDLGLFLYVAWILLIPYYLYKTRGRRAFFTLLILLSIYIGAYFAGVVASAIIRLVTTG